MASAREPDGRDLALLSADRRVFFAALAAHGGSRVLSKFASAPLERIKICLQVSAPQGVYTSAGRGGLAANAQSLVLFSDILASQGPRALWRGSGTHITATCLGGVTRLGLLRTSQMWAMPGGDRKYEGLGAYARRCAFLYMAGAAALLVAYPLDVAYTCLAADAAVPRRYRGFFHFARAAVREHGVLSLYRGFPLCLGTAVPFVAVATAVHDLLAPRLLQQRGRPVEIDFQAAEPRDLDRLVRDRAPAHLYPWNLLLGAFSGFVAQSVTYPLDTLRRRWQHTCAKPRAEAPQSLRECATLLHSEGGVRAFYAGFCVNAAKLLPELAVICGVYHLINTSGSFL